MSLRGLLARLEKLEAGTPAQVALPTKEPGGLKLKFDDIVESAKRFSTLTPRQKIVELRSKLRVERAPAPGHAVASGLAGKIDKISMSFRDITESQLRDAELCLLAELGHPNACHPLKPEYQEILDIELFDA